MSAIARKVTCIVAILVFLGHGTDAACGGSLSSYLARNDLEASTEYLYVATPHNVTVVAGNEFAVVFNGTDGGLIDNFFVSDQSANITLIDSTTSTPSGSPSTPRPTRAISTADRSTVAKTINVLAIVLGLGTIQYFRKGFAPLFVLIIALSMVDLIASRIFTETPCLAATVTLHLPLGTVRFVCVNDEPCVCGPGFTGNDCTGTAPTPVSTPVNPPVSSTCTDAMENGLETDVDCGGGACPKCVPGRSCQGDSDCTSDVCTANICAQPSCTDNVKNGNETDTDCGGTCPNKCLPGQFCDGNSDCTSGICTEGVCAQPTCSDGVENGEETDVDCGGDLCPKCVAGKNCVSDDDCVSKVCDIDGICEQATCSDGVQNGNETDIDCGGGSCPKCVNFMSCLVNTDCATGYCDSNLKCGN